MLPRVLFILGIFVVVSSSASVSRWTQKRDLETSFEESFPFLLFGQPLDHFSPDPQPLWSQRYLLNDQHWGGPGYPIFLLLGGEGPMGSNSVTGHFILNNYAETFKAMIIAVEHRFYGESMPFKDLSTPHLVYLTSQQAIADYANFATAMKGRYPGSKIVSFGGSYSGALSAWIRLKYPEAIDIAVASSGPILAQTDFPQYLDVVYNSLETTGTACNAAIRKGTTLYQSLLNSDAGRQRIQKEFSTCSPLSGSKLDAITFLEFLADTVAGFVQYNNDNNSYFPFDMNKMCSILTSGPIEKTFPAFIAQWNNFTQSNCSDVSYADAISQLKDINPKSPNAAGRTWTWQTCNEFGFYQTGEGPKQPFSSEISLDYFIGMCQEAFGKSLADVNEGVRKTNKYYGARHIRENTTKTVFLNGSIDPWHALGLFVPSNSISVPVIFIKGTAHCADLYPPRDSDVPELTQARAKVVSFLRYWLEHK